MIGWRYTVTQNQRSLIISFETDKANQRTDRIVEAQHRDIELIRRGPWYLAGGLFAVVVGVSIIVGFIILVLGLA